MSSEGLNIDGEEARKPRVQEALDDSFAGLDKTSKDSTLGSDIASEL